MVHTRAVKALAVLAGVVCAAWAWGCADRVIGSWRAVSDNLFFAQCDEPGKPCGVLVHGGTLTSSKDAECVDAGDVVAVSAALLCGEAVDARSSEKRVSLGLAERAGALAVDAAHVGVRHMVSTVGVASGPADTRARVEFAVEGLAGNCSFLRAAFAVAAPTVLPLAYAQAAAPVGAMYAAESVGADGTYTYAFDAAARTAVYDATPRMAARNASFIVGAHVAFRDGAAVVWDHCAQLQHAPADSRPRVDVKVARGVFEPTVPLALECSADGAAWTRLKDVGNGATAAALPSRDCCRVRLAYNETAPDPDAPPYWVLLAYTLTAPVAPAPAHDVHGAQLVFVPYTGDVVKAVLGAEFAAAPPAFDFSADASYTVPVVLNVPSGTVAVEVRMNTTNVELAGIPNFITIESSHTLMLNRLWSPHFPP